jgi:hypothetical protein
VFSDESKFVLSGNGEGVRVWRRALEHFMSNTVHEPVPFGGGSIMVWCGITINTRKDLVFLRNGGLTARRYIDEILERQVIPRANVVDKILFLCKVMPDSTLLTSSLIILMIIDHNICKMD